jgi:hypothetical protein
MIENYTALAETRASVTEKHTHTSMTEQDGVAVTL